MKLIFPAVLHDYETQILYPERNRRSQESEECKDKNIFLKQIQTRA
jgi:hypothetical protein